MRIQANPSWFCNLYDQKKRAPHGANCAYCSLYSPPHGDYVVLGNKTVPLQREMTAKEWLGGFHLIRQHSPTRIMFDFTGGEPTLYSGFVDLLKGIRSYADWSITSNTLLRKRIEEIFAARIDPPVNWTSSWHPGAGKDIDEFIDTLRFIRSQGASVSTTIVLHQSTKDRIKPDLQRIADAGFCVQIHVALMEGYSIETDTPEMQALYEELKPLNRAPTEAWDVVPAGVGLVRDCVAGQDSISVLSDGNIYLCYRHLFCESAPPIGRWGQWTPRTEPLRNCRWACTFACDIVNIVGAHPRLWMGAAADSRL